MKEISIVHLLLFKKNLLEFSLCLADGLAKKNPLGLNIGVQLKVNYIARNTTVLQVNWQLNVFRSSVVEGVERIQRVWESLGNDKVVNWNHFRC